MNHTGANGDRIRAVRGFLQSPLVKGVLAALAVFAVSRVLTLIVAYAITLSFSSTTFLRVLSTWDGNWYLSIVESGYASDVPEMTGRAGQNNIAFFPGLPLAIAGVSRITGTGSRVAGVLISPFAGAGAAALIWVLANRFAGSDVAIRAVMLFSFYPSSFVFSMVYPESLFILFAAMCLLALMDERWILAGVSASLAGIVRPTGIVLTVSCALAAGVAIRRGRSKLAVLAPLLAPLGPLLHFAYLNAHTGDRLAFFHVEERGWDQRFDFGMKNLRRVLDVHPFNLQIIIVGVSIIAGILALYLVIRWRPPAPIMAYLVGIIGLPLLSTATISLPRYFLGAFPLFIPLARAIPDRVFPVAVASSATLMAVLFLLTGTTRLYP